MSIRLEEWCGNCGAVVTALVDERRFRSHEEGNIKCPECGEAIRPCNECDEHDKCDECPYEGAEVTITQTQKTKEESK